MLRKDSVSFSVWPCWDFFQGCAFHARKHAVSQCSSSIQEMAEGDRTEEGLEVLWLLYTTTVARAVFGHRRSRHCQASAISKHCYFDTPILFQPKPCKARLEPQAGVGLYSYCYMRCSYLSLVVTNSRCSSNSGKNKKPKFPVLSSSSASFHEN